MSKIAGELNAEMSKTIGSKEYNEWLNSPLTKALKRSFEQSITDPENQPSQYGTVTLAMYAHLEEQITASQQRVAELEKERDGLISKNQNLFNALMLSTQKKDNMYASIKAASGHLNLYGLFSCVEGDSYDPECADKNVRKANSILRAELTTEIIRPFCAEAGVVGSITRDYPNSDCHGADWTDRDGEYLK